MWFDGRYTDVGGDYLYGPKHDGGGREYLSRGDGYVHDDVNVSCGDGASPPLYQYFEGYHDPILKDQADDWWRLFGQDVPAQFILAPTSVKGSGADSEPMKADKRDEEWDVTAYFGTYRASVTEPCRGFERAYAEENGNGKDRWEEGKACADSIGKKDPIDGYKRECRGRDDWECDFCGMECFCWTVNVKAKEAC